MYHHQFKSPLTGFSTILLIGDKQGIQSLQLLKKPHQFDTECDSQNSLSLFLEAQQQITAYAMGDLTTFDLPLNPQGTEFQRQVWQALQTIPYGEVRSYQQIAAQIGRPKSYRPVGNANNKNPIPVMIPCHRVTPKSGHLGGYALGQSLKQTLLNLESQNTKSKSATP